MSRKMINHGIAIIGIVIAAFLSVASGASAPAVKSAYPGGTELYPAVYQTFAELYPKARYADIDFYNNKYTLTGITGLALTTPISYDMTVRLTPNGELDISYANIYQKDTSTGRWSKAEAFGLYNYNKAVSDITEKMLSIANDPASLDRAEKAAMADIYFVYTIMEKFTDLAFKDFIEKYAKGSVFVLDGPVSDVKESNTTINGVAYKYLVTMNKNLIEDDSLLSMISGKTIYCRFYTNRDDVIRLSKTSVITISATLISAFKGTFGLTLDLAASE